MAREITNNLSVLENEEAKINMSPGLNRHFSN